MIDLLELAERAQQGPKMDEMEWNMGLFEEMNQLIDRHGIEVPDRVDWFNTDDQLAQRAFAAAIDFLTEVGLYCPSTGRRIGFDRKEILNSLEEVPKQIEIGTGSDRRVLRQRAVEGNEPLNFCPGLHSPFEIEIGSLVAEKLASNDRVDFIEGFNFESVAGRRIFGLPAEAYAVRRQVEQIRRAVREAGRPGLAVVLYPLSTHAGALLAALDPKTGLRHSDGMLLSILPDMKVEIDLLTVAIVAHEYGLFTLGSSFSLVGGFCGGIEGAIIEGIAKPIAATLMYRDYVNSVGVEYSPGMKIDRGRSRRLSWARSIVFQALNTQTNLICMSFIKPSAGPGTESNLLEVAIRSIEAQVNGGNLDVVRHGRARMNAGQTPLETRWMLEVADATLQAGFDREQAGHVCRRLAESLGEGGGKTGHTIEECYDLLNDRPRPWYDDIYRRTKERLIAQGLKFR